jgi:hypothetical protein
MGVTPESGRLGVGAAPKHNLIAPNWLAANLTVYIHLQMGCSLSKWSIEQLSKLMAHVVLPRAFETQSQVIFQAPFHNISRFCGSALLTAQKPDRNNIKTDPH